MMLVHGSLLLPLFKSRSEALTSLRGVFAPRSSPPFIRCYFTTREPRTAPTPRSASRALARSIARFCHASRALMTTYATGGAFTRQKYVPHAIGSVFAITADEDR